MDRGHHRVCKAPAFKVLLRLRPDSQRTVMYSKGRQPRMKNRESRRKLSRKPEAMASTGKRRKTQPDQGRERGVVVAREPDRQ